MRRPVRYALVALCLLTVASRPSAAAPHPEPGEELTLRDAIETALRNHPARLAAQSRAEAAGERVGAARSALFPQVLGVAQYLRSTDNGVGDTAYLSAPGFPRYPSTGRHVNQLTETFNNYLAGVSAYQYLFDFGRTRGLIEERNAQADAEAARLGLVDLDLVFQVSSAYYGLVAAKEIVRVFEQAVAQRQEHLREAEVKARAGLRPDIDTYTARSELARTELHLVDARNAAATAKVVLDNAMGVGQGAPEYRQVDRLGYAPVTGTVDPYLSEAFTRRPDLKMLEDEARATGAEITQYRSDRLPSFGAVAGYSARGQDATPGNNLDAGVLITWPIFNGFLTDHEEAEARLRQDAIRHDIDDLRQRIVLEVKRSFLDWQASVERIHQAEQTQAASQVELDLAQKRYDMGLGSIIELTDAQRRFTEDRAQDVQALAAFSVAKAAVDRDTGSSLPEGTTPPQ